MSVRRSARHCAAPDVGAGQTASTLALCVAPEAATGGAIPNIGAARAPRTTAAPIRRVTPEIRTNLTTPQPPHDRRLASTCSRRYRVYQAYPADRAPQNS